MEQNHKYLPIVLASVASFLGILVVVLFLILY